MSATSSFILRLVMRSTPDAVSLFCIFTTGKTFLTAQLHSFRDKIGMSGKPPMSNARVVEPLIVVGIYNTKSRVREYTPTNVPKLGGGRADRYAKFLIEEVKPFVEREYRTLSGRRHTGIGGSSLGGLVSLYLGLKHCSIFGKIGALSPSVWWNQLVIHRFVKSMPVEPRPRIWLDIGTREGPRVVQEVERFRDVLLEKGWRLEQDLHYERVEGGEHSEAAWAQRVRPFLQFLYPAAQGAV